MSDLKKFFEAEGGRACRASELLEFKHACTPEEYEEYVRQAKAWNAEHNIS